FNRTGGIPLIFGALTPAGLTIASGELPTASQQTTFDAMGMFMGVMTDPFVAGRGERLFADAPDAPEVALELVDRVDLPHGVVYLAYRPAAGASDG
ncbi:MAG TPA: hypothetical protein VGO78_04350, partial [Acidimicrobiales bacterium]|nr:hypothetical protein [Acidimicrobiales bacterium]